MSGLGLVHAVEDVVVAGRLLRPNATAGDAKSDLSSIPTAFSCACAISKVNSRRWLPVVPVQRIEAFVPPQT